MSDASRPSRACAACASFGVRPNRELGQNFLDRLEHPRRHRRAAELGPRRRRARGRRRARRAVASTSPRAPRTCTSSSSTAGSSRRCATRSTRIANATLHFADAVKLDLAALDPAPTKVVANLPYGVAATVILRTIDRAPERRRAGWRWCSSEVGERLRRRARHARLRRPVGARPARLRRAGAAHGLAHRLPSRCRTSTRVLVGLERRGAGARRRLRDARPAPASRTAARRSPARSRSRRGAARDIRDRARAALEAMGRPPTPAPSGCRRTQLRALRGARSRAMTACIARAPGQGQPLPVRRRAARRRAAPARLGLPAGDAGRRADARARPTADATRSSARASRARTSPRARSPPTARRPAGTAPPLRLTIAKRVPVAAGMGGGSADAAAALRLAAHAAGRPDDPALERLAPRLGADVPRRSRPGRR